MLLCQVRVPLYHRQWPSIPTSSAAGALGIGEDEIGVDSPDLGPLPHLLKRGSGEWDRPAFAVLGVVQQSAARRDRSTLPSLVPDRYQARGTRRAAASSPQSSAPASQPALGRRRRRSRRQLLEVPAQVLLGPPVDWQTVREAVASCSIQRISKESFVRWTTGGFLGLGRLSPAWWRTQLRRGGEPHGFGWHLQIRSGPVRDYRLPTPRWSSSQRLSASMSMKTFLPMRTMA